MLGIQLIFSGTVQSAPENYVKEINLVFLHGMGGSPCSLQLLSDRIVARLPLYTPRYEQENPNTTIRVNTLIRCYPGYVDIQTWANNIADSIEKHFHGKDNLILIAHSMGGKAALYAVTHNIGGLANKVAVVVTINSPIKSLNRYHVPGGGPILDYCRTALLGSDQGICNSIDTYDSSQDGNWVGANKHWLAFISSERAPLSPQFDRAGVDTWPRYMDDSIVPISAQYSDGADIIYYGEYGHSDFGVTDEVAEYMADQILRYLFGRSIECCVFSRGGILEHTADWLLGTDYWNDIVGEVIASSGSLIHSNESYTRWQEWEDVVGESLPGDRKSSSRVRQVSLPLLTSIEEVRWFSSSNLEDFRLYLRTRAAPRSTVKVDWVVYQKGLLPVGTKRAYYEVEITNGTPLTGIRHASWGTDNPHDVRLRLWSEAQSPFRWFKAIWKVYHKESRTRNIIYEIP